MRTRIVRIAEGRNSTLSHLYIDGIFQCFLLEDKIREVKIMRQTAIPTGNYEIRLNTWGAMNTKYSQKFPAFHKGMVEIAGLPTFSAVYIHIGNTKEDTAGCPLVGLGWQKVDGDFEVLQSTEAYKTVYPKLAKICQSADPKILIENNFQF